MITEKEVQHIAKLARLGLNEEEIKKFQKELSKTLDYIEKLKEVNIADIEPTSHSVLVENVMRKDEGQKSEVKSQNLMDLAPETKNGFLKTKSILK